MLCVEPRENHEVAAHEMSSPVGNARAVLTSSARIRTNSGPGLRVLMWVGEGPFHCSTKGIPPGSGVTYNVQKFWNRFSFEESFLAARERKGSMR